jgi:hypothetical protein
MQMVGQHDEHCIDRRVLERRAEIRAASCFRKVGLRFDLCDARGCGVDEPGNFNAGRAGDNSSQGAPAITETQKGASQRAVRC